MRWNSAAEHGEPTPPVSAFKSLGEWFQYMRTEGFNVPTQVPWAIQRAQKALDLGADEAIEWLEARRLLFVYPGGITVDLRATSMDIEVLAREARDLEDESE
jgi:hypothetical protein